MIIGSMVTVLGTDRAGSLVAWTLGAEVCEVLVSVRSEDVLGTSA